MKQAPRQLFLPGPVGRLEALARHLAEPRALVVLAHPHPQFGGTMHHPVIFHVDRDLLARGISALRFNFRGVGESEGVYDEGIGEVEDVAAAVQWCRGQQPAVPLILVGYSFGSICCIRYAVGDAQVKALVAIGLPLRLYTLPELSRLPQPLVVVQGSRDQFGEPAAVESVLAHKAGPGRLLVVAGAEHLFENRAREVATLVGQTVAELAADNLSN